MEDRTDKITDTGGAWLLGPADLDAIGADTALLDRLAAGTHPDEDTPTGARLAGWLREVENGATR